MASLCKQSNKVLHILNELHDRLRKNSFTSISDHVMGHYTHHIWFDHHIHGWMLVGGGGCVTMLYIVNYLFALWTHLLCIVLSYWNYNVKIVVGVSHLWCPVHWCPHSYEICGIFTCKKVQTSSFLLHCSSITLVHIVTCQVNSLIHYTRRDWRTTM